MPRPQVQDAPYTPATLPEGHVMVRLGAPMGSGNFVCTDPEDVERLVELPNKVRRNTFAARGMFAFVQLFDDSDGKLAGEITHIISGADIKAWRKAGEWPKAFDVETEAAPKAAEAAGSDDDEEDALPENPNRRHVVVDQSDSEDAWEESDDE